MKRGFAGGLALALLLATPAAAQQRVERFAIAYDATRPQTVVIGLDENGEPSTIRLITGGVLGGAIGAAGLGFAGAGVGCILAEGDFCAIAAVPGIVLGEAVGMGLGVWLADEMRGNGAATFLASFAGALVGVGALVLTFELAPITLPIILAGQLAAVIAVERATVEQY